MGTTVPELLELDPVPPSPDGELTMAVRCSTVRTGTPGREHEITVAPDWSLRTPHDLDLERIAQGMGGYLTCLDLADHVLPAARELTQLQARRVLPDMTRLSDGRWTLPCPCPQRDHLSAVFAADHARDIDHVARVRNVCQRLLRRVMGGVTAAWGTALGRQPGGAEGLVREFDGLERLWSAGVHPLLIERLHERVWPGDGPMPLRFYLGVLIRRPDHEWLARTLAAVPDEDVAVWLCWTETELDRRHPDARAAWLRAGVPRIAITGLLDGDYTPADVARLAERSSRSVSRAASTLAAWAHARCHPSVADILELDEFDVDPFYAPSPAAVDWLQQRSDLPRTRLALVLAVCGNRRSAHQLLQHGVHDLRAVAAHVRPEVMA